MRPIFKVVDFGAKEMRKHTSHFPGEVLYTKSRSKHLSRTAFIVEQSSNLTMAVKILSLTMR